MKIKDRKLLTYFIINIIIIISSTLGIVWALFSGSKPNPNTFLYFTTQTNILVLVLAAIFAKKQCNQLKGKTQTYSSILMLIKYISTVAITITFIVYSALLLPELLAKGDFAKIFTVNNFTLHYITPILAIVSFFMFDKNYLPKTKHAFLTIIAPLIYFVFVIVLSLLPGTGYFGSATEPSKFPYFFLNYQKNSWFGFDGGVFGLGVFWWVIILFVVISALGYGYIVLFNKVHKNERLQTKQAETKENTKKNEEETKVMIKQEPSSKSVSKKSANTKTATKPTTKKK